MSLNKPKRFIEDTDNYSKPQYVWELIEEDNALAWHLNGGDIDVALALWSCQEIIDKYLGDNKYERLITRSVEDSDYSLPEHSLYGIRKETQEEFEARVVAHIKKIELEEEEKARLEEEKERQELKRLREKYGDQS